MPHSSEEFEAMRERTREKIIVSALSLFAHKGLSVTVDEIARCAGISKGQIYNHYASKDALITALVQQASQTSSQSIKLIALSDEKAINKIKQITYYMCEMLQNSSIGIETFIFMMQVGMSDFKVALYSAELPSPTDSLANIIEKGQAEGTVVSGNPTELSTVYWAVIQGLCSYIITGTAVPIEKEIVNRILLKEIYL